LFFLDFIRLYPIICGGKGKVSAQNGKDFQGETAPISTRDSRSSLTSERNGSRHAGRAKYLHAAEASNRQNCPWICSGKQWLEDEAAAFTQLNPGGDRRH
jgi:hypothetical protein